MTGEAVLSPAPSVPIPKVALVGCGAIAEAFHLPALARNPAVMRQSVLVDMDQGRADRLARRFGSARSASDYREVLGDVDGVILTVPHHLHYPLARECLQRGLHVLCEKPLAESKAQVEELVEMAAAHRVSIGVNNWMRLSPTCGEVYRLIRAGAIGEPRRLTFLMGEKFDWPAASGFYVGAGGTARGVILDKGPHALDLICWWLGGRPTVVRCEDDSSGGIEAVASIHLELGQCEVEVHLSWLSKYENGYRIEGTEGALEAGLYDWDVLRVTDRFGRKRRVRLRSEVRGPDEVGPLLIANFLSTIRGQSEPLIPAAAVLDSIAVIEESYARRVRYAMPWQDIHLSVPRG